MNDSPGGSPFGCPRPLGPGRSDRSSRPGCGIRIDSFAFCAVGLICLWGAGCDQNRNSPSSASGRNPEARQRASDRADDEPEEQPAPRAAKTAKSNPRKKNGPGGHIGEIPRDAWPEVFFQEPLTVLAEGGATGAAPSGESPAGEKAVTAAPKVEATVPRDPPRPPADARRISSSGGEDDWAALLSGEELASETKSIKAGLAARLQSVGKYSSGYKELRVDGATLAVLAGIAGEHPEPPGWKANARYVRDVSAEMVKAAQANGEKFYKPTRAAFDKLDTLLSGSKPPGLEEAAETVPFSEVARRGHLMLRLDRAFNYMKLQVNTEALFKKEKGKVAHEGAIVAALARAIATPGYDDADIDDYRKFARGMQDSGVAIVEATKGGDYQAFTEALDRCSKACTACHMEYRTN